MKKFKCAGCGKEYNENDHPIVKGTKMDGCCSVGSLVEIKEDFSKSTNYPFCSYPEQGFVHNFKYYWRKYFSSKYKILIKTN